jgi:hypothetical protein
MWTTARYALGGSPFPILFQAMEDAHGHESGLSAMLTLLQNNPDPFCEAYDGTLNESD